MTNNKWSYDNLENYIREDKYSICREERQYTLYLYNILNVSKGKFDKICQDKVLPDKIFRICSLEDGNVDHVFYEPAFMRDCFERERRQVYFDLSGRSDNESNSFKFDETDLLNKEYKRPVDIIATTDNGNKRFNQKLLDYVCEYLKKEEQIKEYVKEACVEGQIVYIIEEIQKHMSLLMSEKETNNLCLLDMNFGGKAAKTFWNKRIEVLADKNNDKIYLVVGELICFIMSKMMKAQPDLAVLHTGSKGRYLHFYECKFESEEDVYVYRSSRQEIVYSISQVGIQKIIVEFLSSQIFVSDKKLSGKASKLVFVREEDEDMEEVITIGNLVTLSNLVFSAIPDIPSV